MYRKQVLLLEASRCPRPHGKSVPPEGEHEGRSELMRKATHVTKENTKSNCTSETSTEYARLHRKKSIASNDERLKRRKRTMHSIPKKSQL